jgi:glycosyltransferase involved in cell wall biosynthesis
MVSRLSHEKGIERAIAAAAYAAERKLPVALHVVGSGPKEAELKQIAMQQDVGERIHFYGEQGNPYRYMKNADLFLLTSFHEAAPMVLEEARCLGVPILTVRTTSSVEMVERPDCGWVCENTQQALNEMFVHVLENREALLLRKHKLQGDTMDNTQALEQLARMIGENYEVENCESAKN